MICSIIESKVDDHLSDETTYKIIDNNPEK